MATKKDLRELADSIENLAKTIITNVDNGTDCLFTASELVKTTNRMVFTLGEISAEEARKAALKAAYAGRVYVRDCKGRFVARSGK